MTNSRLLVLDQIDFERCRQIIDEHFDASHDDEHTNEELAFGAIALAAPEGFFAFCEANDIKLWPWDGLPKRKTRRYDLIRAAALIVAEIERLDRIPSVSPDSGV